MAASLTARYSAYAPIPLVVPNTASPAAHAANTVVDKGEVKQLEPGPDCSALYTSRLQSLPWIAARRSVQVASFTEPEAEELFHVTLDPVFEAEASAQVLQIAHLRHLCAGGTTRHPGYAISQRKRKRIEECFGWLKTIALMRKLRHRGVCKVDWIFTFARAAYNLVRMRNLAAAVPVV